MASITDNHSIVTDVQYPLIEENKHIEKMEDKEKPANGKIAKRNPQCPAPMQILKSHYGSTTYNRSQNQLDREKYLVPIAFSRWWLIPAAVIIQFCCGSLYAWSVYNKPIEEYMYGNQTNTASMTFNFAVGCLGISASVFGPWLERNGPMNTACLGTCLFFLAQLISALAVYLRQMWLLYIGYGILGGSAIGICYISPVSALQKFFPDRRGLASGFAVCGFGAGSIAASYLQLFLINAVGVPLTFVILGCSYFCLMIFAAIILRTPPPGYTVGGLTVEGTRVDKPRRSVQLTRPTPTLRMTLIESLKNRDFWLMFAMFFANVITGLAVLSRLSDMVQNIFGRTKETGSMVVSVNGGFNLAGRFVFSLISDKIGRKTVYLSSLCTQAVIIGCMDPILNNKASTYWPFVVLIWILSGFYGCSFGVIPAFLADMFGASNIGACHGVMLVGWSIAGVGGGLIYAAVFNSMINKQGYTNKDAEPYLINFHWLIVIVIMGFILALFIRTNPWHRLLAALDRRKRVFYFSLGPWLVRIDFSPQRQRIFSFMKLNEVISECDTRGGVAAFEKLEHLEMVNGGETEVGIVEKL